MLAAYVNPRTTRLATVSREPGRIVLGDRARVETRDFDRFETILQRYLGRQEAQGEVLFVAVAGPITDNTVSSVLLPWPIDGKQVEAQFGFGAVRLVNEHFATASGLFDLPSEKLFTINDQPPQPGHIGIMAVDDTLEEVLMVRHEERYVTFLTNGGHTGFAPATQLESELWQYLYSHRDVIEVGDILSTGGLVRLYEFYLESRGRDLPMWFNNVPDRTARVIEEALSGEDELAVDAVDLFVDCFAGEAANLALRGVTSGGIYLGGRMITELLPALDQGRFLDNFLKRGAADENLSPVPVHVLMNRTTALWGAARLAMEFEHLL